MAGSASGIRLHGRVRRGGLHDDREDGCDGDGPLSIDQQQGVAAGIGDGRAVRACGEAVGIRVGLGIARLVSVGILGGLEDHQVGDGLGRTVCVNVVQPAQAFARAIREGIAELCCSGSGASDQEPHRAVGVDRDIGRPDGLARIGQPRGQPIDDARGRAVSDGGDAASGPETHVAEFGVHRAWLGASYAGFGDVDRAVRTDGDPAGRVQATDDFADRWPLCRDWRGHPDGQCDPHRYPPAYLVHPDLHAPA